MLNKISAKYFIIFLFVFSSVHSQIIERGFGYSSLVHCRRGGKDVNNDRLADYSYLQVFSEKAYGNRKGKIAEIYDLSTQTDIQNAYILKTADLNGDGLSEIIVVYRWGTDVNGDSLFDGSKLFVYDGIDGSPLFSFESENSSKSVTKCNNILIGDFNGNGKNDIAYFNYSGMDLNGDKIPESVELNVFDFTGSRLFGENFALTMPNTKYLNACVGDFNADQSDDLAIAFAEKGNGQNVVIIGIDVKNQKRIFTLKLNDLTDVSLMKAGDFNKDGKDEMVLVSNSASNASVNIVNTAGNILNNYSATAYISSLFVNDFAGDYSDEIAFVENVKTGNKNHSRILDFGLNSSPTVISPESTEGADSIYLTDVADFNNDGKMDLAFCRKIVKSDEKTNKLSIVDFNGNIIYEYDNSKYPSEVRKKEKIFYISHGDFNGDGKTDISIAHTWGVDVTKNGYGDNSYLTINDIRTDSTIFFFHPFDNGSGGYGGYLFATLNNNISDRELLRRINFNSDLNRLSGIYSYFIRRDYSSATEMLYEFYKTLDDFNPIEMQDYYLKNNEDILIKYIKNFSVFAGKEEPPVDSWNNYFRAVATIHVRLKRINSTFWYRLRNNIARLNKSDFLTVLKALNAHLIFLSRDDQFTYGTNHGILFELLSYVPAATTLYEFKDFRSGTDDGWMNIMKTRLDAQLAHVLPDGVHDEHSFYYAFRTNLAFNKIVQFVNENNFFIVLPSSLTFRISEKIKAQNVYMMYAVKPVPIFLNSKYVFTQSDIPCIGDTKGVWGNNLYGKIFDKRISESFLLYPEYIGSRWEFKDATVYDNLKFVANGLVDFPNNYSPPKDVSKIFKSSGIFISRSDWVNQNGDFDSLARYCYFKGGEMIPTPGPYNGYSTSSYHAHADLETVEISGFGKNLITELGGYVNPADTQIINNLPAEYFKNLYGYDSNDDNFNTARHYFKGTAAHNTVYVNNEDQAEFSGHYLWGGISELKKTNFYFAITPELDYYRSGYRKGEEYTHVREMFYVKPQIQSSISNDYWIFLDNVSFDNLSQNKTEQIWHIAPLESDGNLETAKGIYQGKNFSIVPLKDKDEFESVPKLIDSYNLTDLILIKTKSLKYVKTGFFKNARYLTIIFPYLSQNNYSNFSLERTVVKNEKGELASPDSALGIRFGFKEKGSDYLDYLFFSFAKNKSFYWFSGTSKEPINSKFALVRFKNGKLIKSVSLSWYEVKGQNENTSGNNLQVNYVFPNPFSNFTKISLKLSEKAKVRLEIFNILGQKIKTLFNGKLSEGNHSFQWNGDDSFGLKVATGIYFCRIVINGKANVQKIVRLK